MSKPTTQPKTPTLAHVERLVKRLGLMMTCQHFRMAEDPPRTYPRLVMDVGTRLGPRGMKLLIQVFPKTRREGQAMLFAALSALPDAKGGQR